MLSIWKKWISFVKMIENDWIDFILCLYTICIFVNIYFSFEFSIYIYFLDIYIYINENNFSGT